MIDWLQNLLTYNENEPLIFTRFFFWGFFTVVLAIYCLVYKKKGLRNAYLFAVSLFFYYKTSGLFLFILLFSTATDYFIGKAIYGASKDIVKKWLVALSVTINLLVLSYFKYAQFVVENVNEILGTHFEVVNYFAMWANIFTGSHFEVGKILLPVGISFFTFQTISYAIDVYRGDTEPVKNIFDFGFYVSFFPQLVAGPIVRASEFIPQLYQDYKLSRPEFGMALYMILKGLTKKLVIGDYIAVNFIDRVFENPTMYSGFESLMSLYGYSLQVYCDFSGYTDVAIGVALLMGFTLPTNFNSPYKATSVAGFWKRWHMSLSSWLKDYLYIPMGGNREGSWFTYIMVVVICLMIVLLSGSLKVGVALIFAAVIMVILAMVFPRIQKGISHNINLLVTMVLGGLWHGSSWQFVIWGGLNGLGLVVYKLWKKISPWDGSKLLAVRAWRIFLTFNFITFTRIWFRGETPEKSQAILHQIGNNFDLEIIPKVLAGYPEVFLMMLAGMIIHWLPESLKDRYKNVIANGSYVVQGLIVVVVVFLIYQSLSSDLQPFIYFQF
ncbi:MAG: MBOAT family protein [Flavobacteriales bacterium]|nr:MBOAT family protein [Flavobacteriales bacterium]